MSDHPLIAGIPVNTKFVCPAAVSRYTLAKLSSGNTLSGILVTDTDADVFGVFLGARNAGEADAIPVLTARGWVTPLNCTGVVAAGDKVTVSTTTDGYCQTTSSGGFGECVVGGTDSVISVLFTGGAGAGGGAGDMILAAVQTVTGAKTFNAGKLKVNNAGNTFATILASLATAARTLTAPDATDTIAVLGTAQAFTGVSTFNDGTLKQNNSANTFATLFASLATAARTWTFPDATDTAAGLATAQTFATGVKLFLDGKLALQNAANTFAVTFANTVTAARTLTLPDVTSTVAVLALRQTFAKNQEITENDYGSISAAAIPIDSQYGQGKTSLTGACTLSAPLGSPAAGSTMQLAVTNATGTATLAYNATFKFPGGVTPTLSTGASARDVLSFRYNGASWDSVINQAFA